MRKQILGAVLSAAYLLVGVAESNSAEKTIRIGVLTDLSGLYSDLSGEGSVLAAQMAKEDAGLERRGWRVELISGDHLNKPDVATNIARQWIERDSIDVIADVPTSSVALAVSNLARDKNVVALIAGAASSDLTNAQCSPNTVHWTYDTYMLANSTGSTLIRAGADSWFFLTADYAFGSALERDTTTAITKAGGKVVGSVKHPLNSSDFSSFLLQAQASKAKTIGLANAGGDASNAIKQAAEFGIVSAGQKLAGLLVFITDVHSLGLRTAQGLTVTETFYWDLNDGTREFAKRFMAKMRNKQAPTMVHAGVYSSLVHYFKALEELGGNPRDGAKVVAKMKEMPTDDTVFGKGLIQQNGRKIHPAYLFEVKAPSESKGPWDYYRLVGTTPADQAFRDLSESVCPLLKK